MTIAMPGSYTIHGRWPSSIASILKYLLHAGLEDKGCGHAPGRLSLRSRCVHTL